MFKIHEFITKKNFGKHLIQKALEAKKRLPLQAEP